MKPLRDEIAAEIFAALDADHPGGPLGVAVSGGGDSLALMQAADAWATSRGAPLHVATVDHGLRAESGEEASRVLAMARRIGREASILRWEEWDGKGNLQAAARDARRKLLAAWASRRGLAAVALGHTMDDQAETVLMRLGRGSGVDGLSAMSPVTKAEGVVWLRPMLGLRREALRDWLAARGLDWIDDPSNENPRYDRARARRALASLADLGVTAEGLARTASRLAEAREALDAGVARLAEEAADWGALGELRLFLPALRQAPTELTRRLVRAGLTRVAGAEYGPRAEAEQRLLLAMMALRLGGGRSLHGCVVRPDGPLRVVVTREVSAIDATPAPPAGEGLWDGRFRIATARPLDGALVAPLGVAGVRRLAELGEAGDWRPPAAWAAAPRAARLATPALWRSDLLAAAPLAGYGDEIDAAFAAPGPIWGPA